MGCHAVGPAYQSPDPLRLTLIVLHALDLLPMREHQEAALN
jgi:hypothetical protein